MFINLNDVKLIDFGLAKQLHKEDFDNTNTGSKGTAIYMAPELFTWNRRK